MKSRSPLLVGIGAGLVALLVLFAAMDFWRRTLDYNRRNPDPYKIGFQEPRFRKAAAELPDDAVLGYVSNLDRESLEGSTAFFGCQYALTPRILVPAESKLAPDLVLGNFSDFTDPASFAADHGMTLVKDFGLGVVLFRRGGAK
jgi:hypothetical protein